MRFFNRRTLLAGMALATFGATGAVALGQEIHIALFGSTTGTYAFGGVPIQNGMRLAIEEANKTGAVTSIARQNI